MNYLKTNVKDQIKLKTNWMDFGTTLYVIDYTKFLQGLETELDAENNAYIYWETKNGIKFQDDRSKLAYFNNLQILAQN